METLERPVSHALTPDELIRFVKEADATHDQFESFDWKDQAGRKWSIRPGVKDQVQVILIQCSREGVLREAAIPFASYTPEGADALIRDLDQHGCWQ